MVFVNRLSAQFPSPSLMLPTCQPKLACNARMALSKAARMIDKKGLLSSDLSAEALAKGEDSAKEGT